MRFDFGKRMSGRLALAASVLAASSAASAATYYWSNPAGGTWATNTNWSPNGVPTSGDDVIIDDTFCNTTATITLSAASSARSLRVGRTGLTSATFTLDITGANAVLTIAGDGSAGTPDFIIDANGIVRNRTTNGTNSILNTGANSTAEVRSGATYLHETARSFAGVFPINGTVAFQNGSQVTVYPNVYTAPTTDFSHSFWNLTLVRTTGTGVTSYGSLGATSTTVRNNFTIGTGTGITWTATTAGGKLHVGGDLIMSSQNVTFNCLDGVRFFGTTTSTVSMPAGVTLSISNATGGSTVDTGKPVDLQCTATLAGSLTWNGPIRITTGSAITLSGAATNLNGTGSIDCYGTLNCGTNVITSVTPGAVVNLRAGATLGIGSASGIVSGNTAGQFTGTTNLTVNYEPGLNFNYNGTVAQSLGSALPNPIVGNLTISNTGARVSRAAGQAINIQGTMAVNGQFDFIDETPVTGSGNYVTGASASASPKYKHRNGIWTNGIMQGQIQVTGNRVYTTTHNPVYEDASALTTVQQVSGNGLPTQLTGGGIVSFSNIDGTELSQDLSHSGTGGIIVSSGGYLVCRDTPLTGTGFFQIRGTSPLGGFGILGVRHLDGIYASGAQGQVQLSGTRTFGNNTQGAAVSSQLYSMFVFMGNGSQRTGTGIPTPDNGGVGCCYLAVGNPQFGTNTQLTLEQNIRTLGSTLLTIDAFLVQSGSSVNFGPYSIGPATGSSGTRRLVSTGGAANTFSFGSLNASGAIEGNILYPNASAFQANDVFRLNGAGNQFFGGTATASTINNLVIDTTASVSLLKDITVANQLSLKNGALTPNGFNLTVTSDTLEAVTHEAGYVNGSLQRVMDFANTGTRGFPVGSATGVAPTTVTLTAAGSGTTTFTVTATGTAHPTSPGGQRLNRYWTLNPGAGLTTTGTASLDFGWQAADAPGSTANYVVARLDSGLGWQFFTGGATTLGANSASVSNVSDYSDWTVGELAAVPVSLSGLEIE